MEKYYLQSFAEAFARQSGLSQTVAEQLSKTFFDTILEGLETDGLVKINGLGTFKIVEVAPRESVNVNNGERILIAGYKKVNFIPDESTFTEIPSDEAFAILQEQIANMASPDDDAPTAADDTPAAAEVEGIQLDAPQLENVEQPQNDFSAIDLLISTPESLDDLRAQYEAAKVRAAETLKAANEANNEKCRLEKLIAQLEANTPPLVAATPIVTEGEPAGTEAKPTSETPAEEVVQNEEPVKEPADTAPEALSRYLNDKPIHDEPEETPRRQRNWLWWLLIPIMGLLLAEVGILVHKYNNKQATPTEQPQKIKTTNPHPSTTAKPQTHKTDTLSQTQTDTTKTAAQPMRTYTLKPGDSLTKIAQRVYGSKDSVRVILRANKFPNPDNVPVGAVINLP